MGSIYRAHQPLNLMPWAREVVPDIAGAKLGVAERVAGIQSVRAGTAMKYGQLEQMRANVTVMMDNLARSRAIYPLELRAAKLKTDLAQSEMKRFDILNSTQNLELTAERKRIADEGAILEMQDSIQGMKVIKDFESKYRSHIEYLRQYGSADETFEFYQDAYEKYGENARHLMLSPYSYDNTKRSVSDRKKQELADIEIAFEKKRLVSLDVVKDLRTDLDFAKLELEQEAEKKVKVIELLGVSLSEMGARGEKRTRGELTDQAFAGFFARLAERTGVDPRRKGETDLYKNLALRWEAGFLEQTRQKGKLYSPMAVAAKVFKTRTKGFRRFELYHPYLGKAARIATGQIWPFAASRGYWKDADEIYDTLTDMTVRIDSKNPAASKKAQRELEVYLQKMQDFTPFLGEIEALRKKGTAISDYERRLSILEKSLMPLQPARQPTEIRHISERRGPGWTQPSTVTPDFSSEATARQAGHKSGDIIKINGVTGKLD